MQQVKYISGSNTLEVENKVNQFISNKKIYSIQFNVTELGVFVQIIYEAKGAEKKSTISLDMDELMSQ